MSIRVLVAGNDIPFVNTVRQALQAVDCELLLAKEISLALYLAHKNVPDLVLCATSIASNNGLDFLTELQADPDLESIPVIFVCANDTDYSSVLRTKSFENIISATIEPDELLKRIRPYLKEHQILREPQTPE